MSLLIPDDQLATIKADGDEIIAKAIAGGDEIIDRIAKVIDARSPLLLAQFSNIIHGALVGAQGVEDKTAADVRGLLGAPSIAALMQGKKLVVTLEDRT